MTTLTQRCRIVAIPGPPGPTVTPTPCINGSNAWATLADDFTMPAQLGAAFATFDHTDWLALGEPVWVETLGTLEVIGINGNDVFLKNLQDGVGGYAWNAFPGFIGVAGLRVTPTGFQGISGVPGVVQYGSGPPDGTTPVVPPIYIDTDTDFKWIRTPTDWIPF